MTNRCIIDLLKGGQDKPFIRKLYKKYVDRIKKDLIVDNSLLMTGEGRWSTF